MVFMLDEVKAAAPRHPEWKDDPVFKAVAARDREALAAMGHKPVLRLLAAANSGMTVESYDRSIRRWLEKPRHPRFGRPYTELVYAPMQELLGYLRGNGFKTYVVSGGSIEFMRPWAEQAYGIPPEQIIGSVWRVALQAKDGKPVLVREPAIDFVDDGTAAGEGPRLAALLRHTDAEREYAYDRRSRIGRLDKALDEAGRAGWLVVDMKRDWNRVFPEGRAER